MNKPAKKFAGTNAVTNHSNRLETLLKNLPGMAYRCLNLEHWPMSFVSEGCFELCGYHRHELENQQVLWGDFTHPDMINEVDFKVHAAADKGLPFEVEYKIITREGLEKWVWERGRVVDMRDDGVAILEGFITDITDRKRAETALMRAEAYAQAIVDSAVEAVITIDNQGIIEKVNKVASEMFGYSATEIRGNHCRNLFAVEYYREFEQYFTQIADHRKNAPRSVEFNGCDKNRREFPIVVSMQQILDEHQQKFVILIRDLSEQRTTEKEVRSQRDMLAHVDRLNTLGEMAAGIAHEINQPLTAISMYAQSSLRFLQKNEPQISRLQDALEKLSQQAHRAGAVIERMQEMTRPSESHEEVVEAEQLLRDIHNLGEVEAQSRNFIIALRLDDRLPQIKCDPVQIQQVILNLLRNGMESMKTNQCKPGSKIILQAQNQHKSVKICITDSGIGISRQQQKKLYQPFASSKEAGMGLGLSISRSIISAHGGQLEFSNNKGGGASFYFSLGAIR